MLSPIANGNSVIVDPYPIAIGSNKTGSFTKFIIPSPLLFTVMSSISYPFELLYGTILNGFFKSKTFFVISTLITDPPWIFDVSSIWSFPITFNFGGVL